MGLAIPHATGEFDHGELRHQDSPSLGELAHDRRIILKLLANLTEPQGGDAADRVINALSRLTPAA